MQSFLKTFSRCIAGIIVTALVCFTVIFCVADSNRTARQEAITSSLFTGAEQKTEVRPSLVVDSVPPATLGCTNDKCLCVAHMVLKAKFFGIESGEYALNMKRDHYGNIRAVGELTASNR